METRDLYGILVWKIFVYGSLWVCMALVWIIMDISLSHFYGLVRNLS